MTVDLSSGIDRHGIGWLIQYVELRVAILGTLDVTFFPTDHTASATASDCIKTAYTFTPCNHILTPHSLSTRLCCTRQSINA